MELILVESELDRAYHIWEHFQAHMSHILLYGSAREKFTNLEKVFTQRMQKQGDSLVKVRQFLRSVVSVDAGSLMQ